MTNDQDQEVKLSPSDDGVTRRDFIHDVSLSALALALPGAASTLAMSSGAAAVAPSERYYPPTLTGMRGSHEGAFEVAHQLAREGRSFVAGSTRVETYDLVVVGAGISGLAAAYFYRQEHPQARILLLDNHDDFGGHAKRNEFHQGGPMRLAWGGTVNIEHWNYSEVGRRLFAELGVDIDRLLERFEYNWGDSGTGLRSATWFDKETYGKNVLLRDLAFLGFDRERIRKTVDEIPISSAGRESLRRFIDRDEDVLEGCSAEQREAFIRGTRYADFLRDQGGLTDDAIQIFSASMMGIWGVRTDDLSVAECLETGLPGAHMLGLPTASDFDDHGPAAMFPDGNASIARLLVRALIPHAFPDMPAERDPFDIVTAELDYGALDQAEGQVALRLSATALRVENRDDGVGVTYARGGALHTVRAKQCVLACYNRIIPHICPSLPEPQKVALGECVKRPLFTINVLLRDGQAISKAGVSDAYLPGSYLQLVSLVTGINVGPYAPEWKPEDPCVLHFFSAPAARQPEGLTMVEQSQAARLELLARDFDDFEREVHRVLRGVWGEAGLDPEKDILAITVNRWPHGYARDRLDLEDPRWLARPGPYELGRQTFGQIAIANSDAGADAYTHTAIDQAWRAVQELPRRDDQKA